MAVIHDMIPAFELFQPADVDGALELIGRYRNLIYTIGLRSGLTEEEGADLLQNVSLIIIEKLDTLKDLRKVTGWIVTTSRREAWRISRERRSRKDEASGDLPGEEPSGKPLQEEELLKLERAWKVREAIRKLGSPCESLLTFLFMSDRDYSYAQVARKLKVPVSSIGPMRMRCLERLRKMMKKAGFFSF